MYEREIDVKQNLVTYAEGRAFEIDCSALLEDNISMICQLNGEIWAEREPFNGRETDFDLDLVESLFSQAQALGQRQDELEREAIDLGQFFVFRMNLSKAIFEKDLVVKYKDWVDSPDRTFLETEELKWIEFWDRRSDLYQSLIQSLGISKEEENRLWMLAKSY